MAPPCLGREARHSAPPIPSARLTWDRPHRFCCRGEHCRRRAGCGYQLVTSASHCDCWRANRGGAAETAMKPGRAEEFTTAPESDRACGFARRHYHYFGFRPGSPPGVPGGGITGIVLCALAGGEIVNPGSTPWGG